MPAAVATAVQYAQVDKLLLEPSSRRSIVRVTGVARMTVAGRAKKTLSAPPLPQLWSKKAQKKRWEALELGERWTFGGRKKHKVWLWLAVERASRRLVAWVVGQRDAATARRQWQAPPHRYHRCGWYFTDLWEAYVGVLPGWQHRRCPNGSGGTSIVEARHCALRPRCGVLVRNSYSFSKSLLMQQVRIKIVIDHYTITLN